MWCGARLATEALPNAGPNPEDAVPSKPILASGETPRPWLEPRAPQAIPESHLASIILDAVERLGASEAALAEREPPRVMQPLATVADPRLTAVHVYRYSHGVLSTRVIEGATAADSVAAFLAGRPRSHEEIRQFRRTHRVALVNVFVDVYQRCQRVGLASVGHVALSARPPSVPGGDATEGTTDEVPRTATALAVDAEGLLSRAEQEDREEDLLFDTTWRESASVPGASRDAIRGARLRAVLRLLEEQPLARS